MKKSDQFITKPVKTLKFGVDVEHQVATIRCVFHDGTEQNTPIHRTQLRQAIENLTKSLAIFEASDQPTKQ